MDASRDNVMAQTIFVLFLCMTLYSFVYLAEFPFVLEAGWTILVIYHFLVQRYFVSKYQKNDR